VQLGGLAENLIFFRSEKIQFSSAKVEFCETLLAKCLPGRDLLNKTYVRAFTYDILALLTRWNEEHSFIRHTVREILM
jgi:hypothetical protein